MELNIPVHVLNQNCLFPLFFNILDLNFNGVFLVTARRLLTEALKQNLATLKFIFTGSEMLPLMSSKLPLLIVMDGLGLLIYGKDS